MKDKHALIAGVGALAVGTALAMGAYLRTGPISDLSPNGLQTEVLADSTPGPMTKAAPVVPACGKERWDIKTLTDANARQVDLSKAIRWTPEAMVKLKPPVKPTARVAPVEDIYAEAEVLLVGYKAEADSDYHLGISSLTKPSVTMIAEVPSPKCAASASDGAIYRQIRNTIDAKWGVATPKFKRLKTPAKVLIRGVLFFDKLHGQTLVAPNGIELHPVRSFVIE